MDRIESMAKARAKGLGWSDISALFSGLEPDTIRRYVSDKYKATSPEELQKIVTIDDTPLTIGVTAGEGIRGADVFAKLESEWQKERALAERRAAQVIRFPSGPVAIVGLADMHIGGRGVDYQQLNDEVTLIAETPNMYCFTVGDIVDNFVTDWALSIRMDTTTSISEEWAAAKWILDKLGSKHLLAVSGNHDAWSKSRSGVDILRGILSPDVIYAEDDCLVRLEVGDNVRVQRLRHKWAGNTTANPTGGIEKLARLDQDFDDGWAAHTHVSSLIRQFNIASKTCHGIQLGSYKKIDDYSSRMGFPRSNEFASAALVMWPDGKSMVTNDLRIAKEIVS